MIHISKTILQVVVSNAQLYAFAKTRFIVHPAKIILGEIQLVVSASNVQTIANANTKYIVHLA